MPLEVYIEANSCTFFRYRAVTHCHQTGNSISSQGVFDACVFHGNICRSKFQIYFSLGKLQFSTLLGLSFKAFLGQLCNHFLLCRQCGAPSMVNLKTLQRSKSSIWFKVKSSPYYMSCALSTEAAACGWCGSWAPLSTCISPSEPAFKYFNIFTCAHLKANGGNFHLSDCLSLCLPTDFLQFTCPLATNLK